MVVFLSLMAGFFLGILNYYLFETTVKFLCRRSVEAPFKRLAIVTGAFRHVFIFLAGICLIQGAHLAPAPLGGGLLASVGFAFWWYTRGKDVGKETASDES